MMQGINLEKYRQFSKSHRKRMPIYPPKSSNIKGLSIGTEMNGLDAAER
jgi:hypothetical protein